MASYQDIDIRLKVVEDKLKFLMQIGRVRGAATTGVLGPDGKPTVKVMDMSMEEVYRMHTQADQTILQSQEPDHPLVEAVNG
jgi:hypothetical protein